VSVPLIDLFAGPGGLGEGFSRTLTKSGQRAFKIALSIEMDAVARQTLKLRSFLRTFDDGPPSKYYAMVRLSAQPPRKRLEALYEHFPKRAAEADEEAWEAELGKVDVDTVRGRVDKALGTAETWVLIGGPPCQAYSLVGRARNAGKDDYVPESDHRQYLYLEYLQVLADHSPAAFVMENVKGLCYGRTHGHAPRLFE